MADSGEIPLKPVGVGMLVSRAAVRPSNKPRGVTGISCCGWLVEVTVLVVLDAMTCVMVRKRVSVTVAVKYPTVVYVEYCVSVSVLP